MVCRSASRYTNESTASLARSTAIRMEDVKTLLIGSGLPLLGSAATLFVQAISRRVLRLQEQRSITARVWRVLEEILIEIEITDAWRKHGGIESVNQMFEIEEPWRSKVPPPPPSIPDTYDLALEKFSEWEIATGKYEITRGLSSIKAQIQSMEKLYRILADLAKGLEANDQLPERPLGIYGYKKRGLRDSVERELKSLHLMRTSHVDRLWKRIKRLTAREAKKIGKRMRVAERVTR